jgi:hypothetical protein
MVQTFQSIMIVGIVLVFLVAVYKMGKQEGKHQERMRLINIMSNIPTIVTEREHVWYVANYIVTQLREK